MKKLILSLAFMVVAGSVAAQSVNVQRNDFGSGTPGATGFESAIKWDNDLYYAPQYLPGYPTAATIWPRAVDVECKRVGSMLNCKGYNWTPEMGRGEYLMIRPHITK